MSHESNTVERLGIKEVDQALWVLMLCWLERSALRNIIEEHKEWRIVARMHYSPDKDIIASLSTGLATSLGFVSNMPSESKQPIPQVVDQIGRILSYLVSRGLICIYAAEPEAFIYLLPPFMVKKS